MKSRAADWLRQAEEEQAWAQDALGLRRWSVVCFTAQQAWNTRDPLSGWSPEEYEAELRRILTGRVGAAYFFGSYGTRDFGRDSDVDLILVSDTTQSAI